MQHVDSRQSALASIKSKADELIKQAGDKEDIAVQGEGSSWGERGDFFFYISNST